MEEFNSTEAIAESGEQEDVVDLHENHDFDIVEVADEPTEAEENQNDGHDDAVDRQSGEDNHAAKLARLKAERDARKQVEAMKSEIDRQIAESGAINPYTEKPFESLEEFKEYGRKVKEADQKARADRDGRTIEEIQEEDSVRNEIRKAKKANEVSEQSVGDRVNDDLIDFMERYPDVDPSVVVNNAQFVKFAGSRFGKESLANLYKDYSELVHDAERSFKADTRQNRSTGSGNGGGERLTASQRKALDEWNYANPDMKMTPSEFLKR